MALTVLAKQIVIPDPDKPNNPNSMITFTKAQSASLAMLLGGLLSYIEGQLERCSL